MNFKQKVWEFEVRWGGNAFDAGRILQVLRGRLSRADFEKACTIFCTDPGGAQQVIDVLNREIHPSSGTRLRENKRLSKCEILRIFAWINRARPTLIRLVAEILDLARFLGATPNDLFVAGRQNARFDQMGKEDWGILLKSGATSFEEYAAFKYKELFEKHVRGQSTKF